MRIYTDLMEIVAQDENAKSYVLLDERNGCVAGCRSGITIYDATEYGEGGVHEDQEGFFVLSGEGMARIGDQEFPIHAGMSFLAPAGVHHVMKSRDADDPVKVLWFHSAI